MSYNRNSAALAVAVACALVAFACRDITEPRRGLDPSSKDLSPVPNIVVAPDSMRGWAFYDDQAGTPCTDPSRCALVAGPNGGAPGSGSVELAASATNQGIALVLQGYNGTRFDRITHLSYSTYRQSVDAGNNLAIALQFNVDYDLADQATGYQGRLVFEPYQGAGGNVTQGTWQHWDAQAGRWWGTRATVSRGGASVANPCVQATPCTWSNLLALFPNVGIHATYGAVVLKAGSGWSDFRGNADGLAIGIDGVITTFDFEHVLPAPAQFSLTVLASPDVVGLALPEDSSYAAGASIVYSFHAPTDGRVLHVFMDSAAVADSGRIAMNGDHALIAYLDDTTTMHGAELTVYNAVRSVISASDPVPAFQSLLDVMISFREQQSDADARIARVTERAVDWQRDSADLIRVDRALGGHSFHVNTTPFEAGYRAPTKPPRILAPGAPARNIEPGPRPLADPTAVIFVNGALNNYTDAGLSFTALAKMLNEQGPLNSPEVVKEYVYNESIRNYYPENSSQIVSCMRAAGLAGAYNKNMVYKGLALTASCMSTKVRKILDLIDILEAWGQLKDLYVLGRVMPDRDVQALAGAIQTHQDAGRNVVVVPHSQGNFITNGALNYLTDRGALKLFGDHGCLSIVPLASPITDYGPVPIESPYVRPVQLAGDIILQTQKFGGSTFPPRANNLNFDLMREREKMAPWLRKWQEIIDGGRIHEVVGSYLHVDGGRTLVRNQVTNAYDACAVKSVDIEPVTPFDSLLVRTSAAFTASALNGAGDTVRKAPLWYGIGDGVDVQSPGVATAVSSLYGGAIVARVGAKEGFYSIQTWGDGPMMSSVSAARAEVVEANTGYAEYRVLITASYRAGAGRIDRCNFGIHDIRRLEDMGEPKIEDGYGGPAAPLPGEYHVNETTCSYYYHYTMDRYVDGTLVQPQWQPASFFVEVVDQYGKWDRKFGKFSASPQP